LKKRAPRRAPAAKRGLGPSSSVIVRQQNLGQQTDSKVYLNAGRPDSRAKVLKQVSPVCHYVNTGSGSITTSGFNGRQAWGYTQISDVGDLQNLGTFLSLGNVNTTQGRVAPAAYLLHKCEHKLKFSNVGQGTCRLTVMHIRAKRDIYNAMNYTAPDNTSYPWGTPVDAIREGVAAANSGPATTDVRYLIPGVDETESPIFNKYFKKMKTTQIFLAVGGTHTLNSDVAYDRVVDASVYGNANLSSALGITDYLLFKAEGQTGITTLDDPPTITIAPCQIAYTQNWDYSVVQVQNSRSFMFTADPIESTASAVSVISGAVGSGVIAQGLIA
jgi:hypothetical protein